MQDASREPRSPSPRSARRSERVERKRQRILESAAHCFSTHGFPKTTVEEIASGAGVSKGLVYAYFGGKEELLDAVLERTLEEWFDATRGEMDRQATDTREALAILHRVSLAFARENPFLRKLLSPDSRVLLSEHQATVSRAIETFRLDLVKLLEEGVRSEELRSDLDVERSAEAILLVHLAFMRWLFDDGLVDVSEPALVEASIELMLRGVGADGRKRRDGRNPRRRAR